VLHRCASIRKAYAAALLVVLALAVPAPAGAGDRAADQQIADDSVLTIDDVPSGFEETPADDEPDVQPGAVCKRIRAAAKAADAAPHAAAEFETPGDETGSALINNQVSVLTSPKQAKAVYAAFAAPKARQCFTTAYQRAFLEQIDDPSAEVQVTVDRFTPDLGDTAVGYEIVIEASAQGESRTFFANLQVIRDGRGLDAFGFFNSGSAPVSDDIDAMTREGVDRLEAALN
jgi:hypothetical protein